MSGASHSRLRRAKRMEQPVLFSASLLLGTISIGFLADALSPLLGPTWNYVVGGGSGGAITLGLYYGGRRVGRRAAQRRGGAAGGAAAGRGG